MAIWQHASKVDLLSTTCVLLINLITDPHISFYSNLLWYRVFLGGVPVRKNTLYVANKFIHPGNVVKLNSCHLLQVRGWRSMLIISTTPRQKHDWKMKSLWALVDECFHHTLCPLSGVSHRVCAQHKQVTEYRYQLVADVVEYCHNSLVRAVARTNVSLDSPHR